MINKKRKDILKKAKKDGKIPLKPNSGDICPHCKRNWGTKENPRNWHRHHCIKTEKFIGWLCGDCNMSFHDQRRKNIS